TTDIHPASTEDTRSNSRDGLKHHSRGAEPITGAAAVERCLGGRALKSCERTSASVGAVRSVRRETGPPDRSAGSGGCHGGPQTHAHMICHRLRMWHAYVRRLPRS